MTATIISIGDELLVGQVVNTNASWLGDQLTRIGCRVLRVEAIGDERELIRREIEAAAQASDVVIVSGGLGPTHDDVTREAICDLLGCDLAVDREQLGRIERRFAVRGIELNERSRRQALAPAACRTLPNDYGSAPGLAFTVDLTAPTTTVDGIAFSADQGASGTDFITNVAAQTISGTLSAATSASRCG